MASLEAIVQVYEAYILRL